LIKFNRVNFNRDNRPAIPQLAALRTSLCNHKAMDHQSTATWYYARSVSWDSRRPGVKAACQESEHQRVAVVPGGEPPCAFRHPSP